MLSTKNWCQQVYKRLKKGKKRGPLAAPPSIFWVYLFNQAPYRKSEHCSTIFITPFIILNTKNRGYLGVLGAKVEAKVRQIWCFVWKTCVKHQKTVPGCYRSHFQTAKHCFPCKYRIIPTCKKKSLPPKNDLMDMNVFRRGGRGPWGGGASKGPSLEKVMKRSIACAGL